MPIVQPVTLRSTFSELISSSSDSTLLRKTVTLRFPRCIVFRAGSNITMHLLLTIRYHEPVEYDIDMAYIYIYYGTFLLIRT